MSSMQIQTSPWRPVGSETERMERREEEAVSICQEEQATPCVSFWRKCTVSFEISVKFINGQYYLQKASQQTVKQICL